MTAFVIHKKEKRGFAMNELNGIKNVLNLVTRLQSLCEGFDDTNKSAIITSKFKILLELSEKQNVSPNVLKLTLDLQRAIWQFCAIHLLRTALFKRQKMSLILVQSFIISLKVEVNF